MDRCSGATTDANDSEVVPMADVRKSRVRVVNESIDRNNLGVGCVSV